MLDAAYIRDNLAAVTANCVARGAKNAQVAEAVGFDDDRKRVQRQFDETRAAQNLLSEQIKKAGKDAALREKLVAESRGMKDGLAGFEAELKVIEA